MLAVFVDRRPALFPDGLGLATYKPAVTTAGHPWRNPKKPQPFFFDASIREEHGVTVDATEEPIEDGGSITDHARVLPDVLTMDVIVSEHKNRAITPAISAARNLNPIAEWKTLVAITKARKLVDVVTSLNVYYGMLIRHVGTPRTVESTNALMITVRLQHIGIASVDAVSNMTEEASGMAMPEQDLGMQGAAEELLFI